MLATEDTARDVKDGAVVCSGVTTTVDSTEFGFLKSRGDCGNEGRCATIVEEDGKEFLNELVAAVAEDGLLE